MTILPDDKLSQSSTDTALENEAIREPFTRHVELVSASIPPSAAQPLVEKWTLERSHRKVKQVQGDGVREVAS